ncbi:hypothetical protein [Streptomyces blattellae]|uniref:hypothetical protein n=1 Tax=Streptomyces blattellae TaxID=2569855 RepID=UPI0012B9B230|nr:hypothetical protein [Streptomyces blattellae]
MTQRLRFVLDGDDNLSPVLNNAGDASTRLHRRLSDDMNGNARAVRGFTQDASGRLRDLRGRFVSVADAQRMMGDGMPGVTRRLGDLAGAGGSAASSLGSSGGGLGAAMAGVAGVAGLSLLPAIGALVPVMAGTALAAGTLKLGFAGVGEAVALAGQDAEKYQEALKEMGPEQRDFTKAVVGVKNEFGGLGKEIQKAMLPGFTRAVKDAGPVVDILGESMTEMGGTFGKAAEGVARLLRDSGFQDDLQTTLQLGTGFVEDMTGALGPFTRSLLDFGAASGPTLEAFSDGISGLLSKGLPGLFDGLETGISGAADMLDGLFSAVNDVLPALGDLSGEVAATFGPVFGKAFEAGGKGAAGALEVLAGAARVARPVLRDVGYGLDTIMDVGRIVGPTLADTGSAIVGAFAPVGAEVDSAVGPLQRLNQWVNTNRGSILEGARIFGGAVIDMTSVAIQSVPDIIRVFRLMSAGVLTALDGVVSGAAKAFGWIPGIGGKLKSANKAFDDFKGEYLSALDSAEQGARDFAASTVPRLSAGKLKLNINNWNSQIDTAKAKLKTVPPSKQASLKATIRDLEAKVASARQQLNNLDGKTANTYVVTHYKRSDGASFLGPSGRYASGGLVGFPGGGPVRGPGTGTSDSVPILASNGEYVINARSTAKHRSLVEAINADRLDKSTGMPGAGAAVAAGLASGMTGAAGLVGSAARVMAAAVTAGIRDELQISSPSKKTKALAKDVGKGFIQGLTGSRDKIRSVSRDLANDIKAAFSGKKESSLLRMVDRQTKKLLDAAAKRDKTAAKIAEARSYASDLTKNAREGASLSSLGMDEEQVTAGGIKAGLASKLQQVRMFTRYIDILAKRGLNKGLLRQILNMGPEAGYAYASALVGADKATFQQINSLQSQLDKSTTHLGRVGADYMYDSGKNASKGFLTGLLSQEKALEDAMVKIAKGMQKSIKKALGISSPAKKLIPDGINTARGVAVGVMQGLPHVDKAMQAVAGRMAGTTGLAPAAGRTAVVTGGSGTTVINIHVDGAVVDQLGFARAARQALLELKRNHGGGDLGIA